MREVNEPRSLHPESPGINRRGPASGRGARQPRSRFGASPRRARGDGRWHPGRDAAAPRRGRAGFPRGAGSGPGQASEDPGRFAQRGPAGSACDRAGIGRGQAAQGRLRFNGTPAPRHLRRRRRRPGAARPPRGEQGSHPPGTGQRPGQPARDQPQPGINVPGPGEVRPRPYGRGSGRQARPGHRPRRGDPPRHPGPEPPDPRTTRS